MVSSTFSDLERHRAELMKALRKEKLFPIGMEDYVPVPGDDIISSSLNMVREGTAYIGLISQRYGQVIECDTRNPHGYSVSRLEFEEAQRLGLPILVFVMSDEHPGSRKDFETDAEKIRKLEAYRERAKEGRIYVPFDSPEDFIQKAIHAVASLRRHLNEQSQPALPPKATPRDHDHSPQKFDFVPRPPAFYAEPAYIGSHAFVGRKAQLDTLSDWASPADPHPLLLFEAIGGTGKSMLTWEWTTRHATTVRGDWAGRFWYSFYEKGAIMADFCRRALAYITGQPFDDFRKMKTAELAELLLRQLRARPWLLVLDGLERVLVAYHRYDAAQLLDEEAGTTDKIAQRDPCAAIRPEDDDLLRALAAAAPSKLLLTTRLTPRGLLNAANQPIPGVLRERLPGLRPADAEALLRSCGVTGTSGSIQNFLQSHCDCHPLVTGVLAGLINDYLPDRGNFDTWSADPDHGGQLNLADLDLVQKRNHILHTALAALPEKSRQLLSTLSLLSEAVDYTTLSALNPHLPPEPEEVAEPTKPEVGWRWQFMTDVEKRKRREKYLVAVRLYEEYKLAIEARLQSPEFRRAPRELASTIRDLEHRGLVQYAPQAQRYDLHPVVRGITAGALLQEERDHFGQRVVDHFSQQLHRPYEEAESLEDVRHDLHVVRTLVQMGRREQACDVYVGALAAALLYNLEAHAEVLSIMRPFFPHSWSIAPDDLEEWKASYLLKGVALAMSVGGEWEEAVAATGTALLIAFRQKNWGRVQLDLSALAFCYCDLSRFACSDRLLLLSLDIASFNDDDEALFLTRIIRMRHLTMVGLWQDAEAIWRLLDPMGRDWDRHITRPGSAELRYAALQLCQGTLLEDHLLHAEQLSRAGKNRIGIRALHGLRGEWHLD